MSRMASTASSRSSGAPVEATITGSMTATFRLWKSSLSATALIISVLESIPVFTASAPISETIASIWDWMTGIGVSKHVGHAERVLRGDGRDSAGAEYSHRAECLQVGLDTGTATRVGACYRHYAWNAAFGHGDLLFFALGASFSLMSRLFLRMMSWSVRTLAPLTPILRLRRRLRSRRSPLVVYSSRIFRPYRNYAVGECGFPLPRE